MDYFFLTVIFFIFSVLTNAQTENNTSVTNQPWFWPLIGVCLALLVAIPSTLLILLLICYNKNKFNDDSDESSIHSNSSRSSQNEMRRIYSRRVEGFRSPPPPYTTTEQPQNIFTTPSQPPPYESHINEDRPTTIDVPPTTTPPAPALDLSTTLASPSIQTFQA